MLKYHLRPKRLLYFAFVLMVLVTLFVNRSHQLQTGKSLFQRTRLETLSDEEVLWLKSKGALKAGVLVDNLPLSGLSAEGALTGLTCSTSIIWPRSWRLPLSCCPWNARSR